MAASNLPSPISHPFSSFIDEQSRLIDALLAAPRPQTCEFEDEDFGCGHVAVVTDIDSERELCGKHFRQVSLWRAVDCLGVK